MPVLSGPNRGEFWPPRDQFLATHGRSLTRQVGKIGIRSSECGIRNASRKHDLASHPAENGRDNS
jgi:hypothetical protein